MCKLFRKYNLQVELEDNSGGVNSHSSSSQVPVSFGSLVLVHAALSNWYTSVSSSAPSKSGFITFNYSFSGNSSTVSLSI